MSPKQGTHNLLFSPLPTLFPHTYTATCTRPDSSSLPSPMMRILSFVLTSIVTFSGPFRVNDCHPLRDEVSSRWSILLQSSAQLSSSSIRAAALSVVQPFAGRDCPTTLVPAVSILLRLLTERKDEHVSCRISKEPSQLASHARSPVESYRKLSELETFCLSWREMTSGVFSLAQGF